MADKQYQQYYFEYGYPPSKPEHLMNYVANKGIKMKWRECQQILKNPPSIDPPQSFESDTVVQEDDNKEPPLTVMSISYTIYFQYITSTYHTNI